LVGCRRNILDKLPTEDCNDAPFVQASLSPTI
jgi:hypothetical protein